MFYYVRTCRGSPTHPNPRPPEQAKPPPLSEMNRWAFTQRFISLEIG